MGGDGTRAAEVLRDLFTTPLLDKCEDFETWAPIDGETRHCLNRFSGRPLRDAETPKEQLLKELLEVYKRRRQGWPGNLKLLGKPAVAVKLHDVRAQLVEFDRYLEAHGKRPPARFQFNPRGSATFVCVPAKTAPPDA